MLETRVGKRSKGLFDHVLSRRMAEGVQNLSLSQHSAWEHGPRYEPARNTNEILIVCLVRQWDEAWAGSHRKTCQRTEEEGEREQDRQDEEGPDLYCQWRERDSDSEGGREIKREKKPQSPLTPCLTPVIRWDTSFWPALIHDCSVQQLSTNQQAESHLTATHRAAIVFTGDKVHCLKRI